MFCYLYIITIKFTLHRRHTAAARHSSTVILYERILTGNPVDGSERPEHPNCADRRQIQVLDLEAILEGTGQHNEEVEPVPGVGQVRVLAVDAHRHHFYGHLHAEEDKDDVVEYLKDGKWTYKAVISIGGRYDKPSSSPELNRMSRDSAERWCDNG